MNLIPVIREALGLQENEEFKIKVNDTHMRNDYRFTNCQLQVKIGGHWETSSDAVLGMLAAGQLELVKLPFKPKEGELYYLVGFYGDVIGTRYTKWCQSDILNANSGNCYRTEEEAEKHVDEWMSKIYGENWKELLK